MDNLLVNTRVLLLPRKKLAWDSLREIIPAIIKCHKDIARVQKVDILEIFIDEKIRPSRLLPCLNASILIVPVLTKDVMTSLNFLHDRLSFNGPIVIYSHGEATVAGKSLIKFERYCRSPVKWICASSAEAKTLGLCYEPPTVAIIPFPLSLEINSQLKKHKSAETQKRPKKIIYAGRISVQKNLHGLIYAFSTLIETDPTLKLHIFGKEDHLGIPRLGIPSINYLKSLKVLVKKLQIEKNVVFEGYVTRSRILIEFQRGDAIFASLSYHSDEDFGVVAFSALLAGLACVLSRWGGHQDFARHFKRQIELVDIDHSDAGLTTEARATARALSKALHLTVRKSAPLYFQLSTIERKTMSILNENVKGTRIKRTRLAVNLWNRAKGSFDLRGQKMFVNWSDALLKPFLAAYGARCRR